MDINLLFKPLVEFEGKLAELYEWYSELFKDDPEAAFLFFKLAAEEHAHVAIIRYQRRLVRDRPGEFFADVALDLKPVEEALALVATIRQAPQPPSLEQAVRAALTLEASAAEHHHKAAMQQANPGVARMLEALGTADRDHVGKLVDFAARRGIDRPAAS